MAKLLIKKGRVWNGEKWHDHVHEYFKNAQHARRNIFKVVTAIAPKTLRQANEWGYLNIGRKADIAVFDYISENFELNDKVGIVFVTQRATAVS